MALYHVLFLFLTFLGILGNSEVEIGYLPSCRVTVKNGQILCIELGKEGITCFVYCDDKFMGIHGCSKDAGWIRPLPHCIYGVTDLPSCGVTVKNGQMTCTELGKEGIFCLVNCDEKFMGINSCSKDAGWSRPLPRCISGVTDLPSCGVTVKNGQFACREQGKEGIFCAVSCDNKFMGISSCSKDAGWTVPLPHCISRVTDLPSCSVTVKNGQMTCRDLGKEGIFCLVSCGNKFMGIYSCSKDAGWFGRLPHCISGVKVNSRCSLALRNGAAICADVGRGKIACTLLCDGRPQGFYRCSHGQGWNRELPACMSGLRESMCNVEVRNGTASCHVEWTGDVACSVLCDGKFQGLYRCEEGRGWDKRLPPCAAYS